MPLRGEDGLVAWLRQRTGGEGSLLGDDGAVLAGRREVVVTVDQQIEGVHFASGLDPSVVARRLLRVNLSDLAAMGAVPREAFLALAAPPGFPHRRFFVALLGEARRFGVRLAGGDLSRAAAVSASLTLLGERVRGGRWLRRGQARPGDRLWLGGTLGESALGCQLVARGAKWARGLVAIPRAAGVPPELRRAARRAVRRHLLPEPQLLLSRWLAARRRVAAIDVSDGLARDLHRLCRASGVGAVLEADVLPVARGSDALSRALHQDWRALALSGGEDYVLLFTLPASAAPPDEFGCVAVGRVTRGPAIQMRTGGAMRPLRDMGFDHLAGGGRRAPVKRRAIARRPGRGRAARRPPRR
jgi:thiamine-monophosphate kinase